MVNRTLASKLLEEKNSSRKKAKNAASLLDDERFKPLFENPEFEVDPNADEYRYKYFVCDIPQNGVGLFLNL